MREVTRAFGRNLWIAAVVMILLVPAGRSQQERSGAAVADAAGRKVEAQVMKGFVDGQTYKNAFLGVEITLPDDQQFHEPELAEDAKVSRRVIRISAGSKPHNKFSPKKFVVDTGVICVADLLAAYPDAERTEEGYMRKMAEIEGSQGFKRIDGKSADKIGDLAFMRANFVQGKRQHVLLATLRKDNAFVFIFIANDMASAEALIASTAVKLPQ